MLSEPQALHRSLRDAGKNHGSALRSLTRRLEVNTATVKRILDRAQQEAKRDRHRTPRRGSAG